LQKENLCRREESSSAGELRRVGKEVKKDRWQALVIAGYVSKKSTLVLETVKGEKVDLVGARGPGTKRGKGE